MRQKYLIPIINGVGTALAGSFHMGVLLALNLIGPKSVENDKLMYGGTLLFISLYLFLLIGIYISIAKTKALNGNTITFKDAFLVGVYTSLSTAIFSTILSIVFFELICPNYNHEMITALTNKIEGSQANLAQVQAKIAEQAKYYSTAIQTQFSFV